MRARRVDGNHTKLRSQWRGLGGSWLSLYPEHGGEPDALVGWRGQDRLIELKDPDKPPSRRRLRDAQEKWHDEWRGRPVTVVGTLAEIVALFD